MSLWSLPHALTDMQELWASKGQERQAGYPQHMLPLLWSSLMLPPTHSVTLVLTARISFSFKDMTTRSKI